MQRPGNPYAVAAGRIPVVARRGEVAEADLLDGFVLGILEVGPQHHRDSHRQPGKGVGGGVLDFRIDYPVFVALDNGTFIHETIAETAVAGKNERAVDNGLGMLEIHDLGFQFEVNRNLVALFSRPFEVEVRATGRGKLFLAVHLDAVILIDPGRNAQSQGKGSFLRGSNRELYLPVLRIAGLHLQGEVVVLQADFRFRGEIKIDIEAVVRGMQGRSRDEGKAPGTVGVATVDVHATLLLSLLPPTLQRAIFGDLGTVVLHRSHQSVVHRPLEGIGIAGIAGLLQQTGAELHPGEGYTGLHRMISGQSLAHLPVVPALEGSPGAGDIDFGRQNIFCCHAGSLEVSRIARNAAQLHQPLVARHHFVSLMAVLGGPPLFGERKTMRHRQVLQCLGDQLRAVGGFQAPDDPLGKFEVLRLPGRLVEIDHRLEDGATGHAAVVSRSRDFRRFRIQLLYQAVDKAFDGFERLLLSRQPIIGQEGKGRILPAPDIPACQPVFRFVVADIAVSLLYFEELRDGLADDLEQFRVLGILIRGDSAQ